MAKILFRNKKASSLVSPRMIKASRSVIIEKSEQELTDLLSPILEEDETWRDKYRYLSLDEEGEVYLDEERYE